MEQENAEVAEKTGGPTKGNVFGEIVGQIDMPEVSEHVIQNHSEVDAEKPESVIASESPENELFDENIHAVDKFGQPIKTKSGKYRRKSGRKKGVDYSKTAQQPTTPNVDSQLGNVGADSVNTMFDDAPSGPIEAPKNGEAVLLSKTAVMALDSIRHVISGMIATDEEKAFLESAWYDWAEHSGAAVNPNLGIVLASGIFMLPTLQQKKTLSLFEKVGRGFRSLFGKRRTYEQKEKSDHLPESGE